MSIRILLRLLVVVCAAVGVLAPRPSVAESTFQTHVPAAILVDYETGTILYEKDADRQFQPSSLAKVMTAEVLFAQLKAGKITLDTPFTVSVNAWRRGGGPSGGAAMFAEVNKPVRVEDLLAGAIVVSGNDAAIALAEGVSGTEGEFAALMNQMAKTIGMSNSDFRNATGFADPGQLSTARDMATLAQFIIRTFPKEYAIFALPGIDWNKIKQRNRNTLLTAGVGADGLQQAWLKEVGYHLLGSAVQNGQRLVVVVLGAKSEKERLDEARKLLDWGFQSFQQREIFAADAEIGRAQVFGGASGSVGLTARGPVRVLTSRRGGERITARVSYTGPLQAPVAKGTQVGQMEVTRGDIKVLEVPLFTRDDVPVGSLWDRALDGGMTFLGDSARGLVAQAVAKLHK
ncbi:D-alanyl-D-alanine carboxypeptidase family protein [Xanthobacter agilis]|uniref:D-alanyl-D-alanine carboxypeptidase family protein n=1 Tax=Xanthobacter agilis TaxID=47492 RepID=UPI0037296E94